jgi:hypothetical protein
LGGDRPPPRRLGRATATTSATFLPHCEQRIRVASAANVAALPALRASASGSMWRNVPHGQVTRTRIVAETLVELLDVGSTRTGAWCAVAAPASVLLRRSRHRSSH